MHFGNISSDPEVCFFMTRHLTHFQISFYFPSGLVLAGVCVFACGCVVYMHTCVKVRISHLMPMEAWCPDLSCSTLFP